MRALGYALGWAMFFLAVIYWKILVLTEKECNHPFLVYVLVGIAGGVGMTVILIHLP